jgi:hypothetical protein
MKKPIAELKGDHLFINFNGSTTYVGNYSYIRQNHLFMNHSDVLRYLGDFYTQESMEDFAEMIMKTMGIETKTYFIPYSMNLYSFLRESKIEFLCSDADIVSVELLNDKSLFNLGAKYAKWLQEAEHDMSINPHADGSKYHRG